MEWDLILIRYGEIALKSGYVRKQLIEKLKSDIVSSIKREGIEEYSIESPRGRIFLETRDIESSLKALSYVPGVVSYSPCVSVVSGLDEIIDSSLSVSKRKLDSDMSFAVNARRVGSHDYTSQDIKEVVGDHVRKETDAEVDLDNPDYTINIEVREGTAYIFDEVLQGLGGIPYGVQGKVVSLFSGGIDSPVATALMMKRGCEPVGLYIDKGDLGDHLEQERAVKVGKKLSRYTPNGFRFIEVNFEDVYRAISSEADKKTCILCKRGMYRAGEIIAEEEGGKGLVTGESIGQVASQTLDNLKTLDSSTELPVYRPLVGVDKSQTQKISRRLGFFEESSKDVGGCSILPDSVATVSDSEEILEMENDLELEGLIKDAVEDKKEKTLKPN